MNYVRLNPDLGPRLIQEGDLVILYERHDSLAHAWMKKKGIIQNRYGCFSHDDMIGKPFGHKAKAYDNDSCWVYTMEPTPELWSVAFKTRTQIVNEMDQSLVTFMLNVKPGDIVVESGTGSACMTLSLARAVSHPNIAKAGHVYTFEYNGSRAEDAAKEMKAMGVDHLVTVRCHDVCAKYKDEQEAGLSGGFPGVAPGSCDALFLDVPSPHEALDYAVDVLKPHANICCYSPCISQVTDTCAKLRQLGFTNIRMVEFRQRPSDGREVLLENIDLGVGLGEETVLIQTQGEKDVSTGESEGGDMKRVRSEGGACTASTAPAAPVPFTRSSTSSSFSSNMNDKYTSSAGEKRIWGTKDKSQLNSKSSGFPHRKLPSTSWRVNRPLPTMKSHTAFLTFARSPLSSFDVEEDKLARAKAKAAGREKGDHLRGGMMPQGMY